MEYLISIAGALAVFLIVYMILTEAFKGRIAAKRRIKTIVLNSDGYGETDPEEKKAGDVSGRKLTKTRKELEQLEEELYDAGVFIPVQNFVMIWGAVTVIFPIIMLTAGLGPLVSGITAVICAALPVLFVSIKRKKRKQALEDQLVDAISVLCNSLRAGHSFQQAMGIVVKDTEDPISSEFDRVLKETDHGMMLNESLERMCERIGSSDLEMLCSAIIIQRSLGGNLAQVLENISGTINARISLKAEIKTRTASGRLSGYIIGALPIILLAALVFVNGGYVSVLFNTFTGQLLLAGCALLEITGFLVISKIVNIKY